MDLRESKYQIRDIYEDSKGNKLWVSKTDIKLYGEQEPRVWYYDEKGDHFVVTEKEFGKMVKPESVGQKDKPAITVADRLRGKSMAKRYIDADKKKRDDANFDKSVNEEIKKRKKK